ncbi:MAG: S-methyl-5-thioribose-1-phosphate isomerase [Thermoanaerobaculia bacterium]
MPETRSEELSPIRWRGDALELLDQTLLPHQEAWLECRSPADVAAAIRRLSVRGAPAIGVAAAYGLVLGVRHGPGESTAERFQRAWDVLAVTRPTAVNLRWALDRGTEVARPVLDARPGEAARVLLEWADGLHAADIEANRAIGRHGAALFASGDRVLTHCNAGALATAGYGTALGVVQAAWAAGRLAMVWVDETRPLLQGARLTAWELRRQEIPYRLVTDSSVGALMTRGLVDRVVVGADRIAANGDTANKIGTYTVAALAARHDVPFYVAAPLSTIDPATATGADIPIEERDADEVRRVFGTEISPLDAPATNFAFDVTPAELVRAIITDGGVLEPPYEESIARAVLGARGAGA